MQKLIAQIALRVGLGEVSSKHMQAQMQERRETKGQKM